MVLDFVRFFRQFDFFIDVLDLIRLGWVKYIIIYTWSATYVYNIIFIPHDFQYEFNIYSKIIFKTQFFKIVLKKAFTVEIFHKFGLGKSLLKFFYL